MANKTARKRAQERRRQRQRRSTFIWVGLGMIVLGALGLLVWNAVRPPAGEEIPIMADARSHIPEGSPTGEYNSNPPTSGPHYNNSLPARFYQPEDLGLLPPNPEGYLVHNLEHGHVIFWYNCEVLDEAGCESLKSEIQGVLNEFNGVKVLAFPWTSIGEPVVMTSWGRMVRFDSFDANQARQFVRSNRNRAPEPNAP